MARQENKADIALSAALSVRQVDAKPRRLETMRQAGLLETGPRPGSGRGRGSRSIRAADEVDRAEYMVRLLDESGSYTNAVLVGFVRGDYAIAKDRLERAYEQSLGSFLKLVAKHATPAAKAAAAAIEAGSWIGRYLAHERRFSPFRERARSLGLVHRLAPMHRVMDDLAADLITVLLGNHVERQRSLAAASTLGYLVGDGGLEETQPQPDSAVELAELLPLAELLRILKSSTMDELVRARDQAKVLRSFAQHYGRLQQRRVGTARAFVWIVVGSASDVALAYATPALVAIRRMRKDRLDQTISLLAEWTPFWAATNTLLEQLPEELHAFVGPEGYESLTHDQRDELSSHIADIEDSHAIELAVLRNPPPIRQIEDN